LEIQTDEQLHGEEHGLGRGIPGPFAYSDQVLMRNGARNLCFRLETPCPLRTLRAGWEHHLERELQGELAVLHSINAGTPAATDLIADDVAIRVETAVLEHLALPWPG